MIKSVPSHKSRWRRRRAGQLSRDFKAGDRDAAWRLLQRYRALIGIKKHGWERRLALANEARKRYCDQRRKRVRMDQLCRPWHESTRIL